METSEDWIKSSFTGKNDFKQIRDVCSSSEKNTNYDAFVGLFVVYGSWNGNATEPFGNIIPFFEALLRPVQRRSDTLYRTGIILADSCDEMLGLYCGDDYNYIDGGTMQFPCPPKQLPTVLLVVRRSAMQKTSLKHLSSFEPNNILSMWRKGQGDLISDESKAELLDSLKYFGVLGMDRVNLKLNIAAQNNAIRIFVAGDRMSVGKTSVCLGILGNLVSMGYSPDRLAYIKPATQNESPQLIQRYCEELGIDCVPIGPIVYYRGFTRAYLAGQTMTSAEMLLNVEHAVDTLSRDKDVVIIDGVGFPAVGSICGTDNASVAFASSYPHTDSSTGIDSRKPLGVLLVGGAGVGSAVDAFNLNAAYFEQKNIPILGVVFNKLSLDGYYSLENCKKEISSYFDQNEYQMKNGRKPFGFIPMFSKAGGKDELDHVYDFIRVFGEYFDLKSLLDSAAIVQQRGVSIAIKDNSNIKRKMEPSKISHEIAKGFLSRDEVENAAITAGAAPSA